LRTTAETGFAVGIAMQQENQTMQLLVSILFLTPVLLGIVLISRRWLKILNQIRRDEWRRVPPPEWAAKRGGVDLW
jgi:hypothetical protein